MHHRQCTGYTNMFIIFQIEMIDGINVPLVHSHPHYTHCLSFIVCNICAAFVSLASYQVQAKWLLMVNKHIKCTKLCLMMNKWIYNLSRCSPLFTTTTTAAANINNLYLACDIKCAPLCGNQMSYSLIFFFFVVVEIFVEIFKLHIDETWELQTLTLTTFISKTIQLFCVFYRKVLFFIIFEWPNGHLFQW